MLRALCGHVRTVRLASSCVRARLVELNPSRAWIWRDELAHYSLTVHPLYIVLNSAEELLWPSTLRA